MPLSFVPLYAALALGLSAVLTVPFVTIPAFADSAGTIRLGFLASIDEPSQLHIATAKRDATEMQSDVRAESDQNSGAWQRGLGPVWVWNPPTEKPEHSVIVSH